LLVSVLYFHLNETSAILLVISSFGFSPSISPKCHPIAIDSSE
jgi:hypothetical protein